MKPSPLLLPIFFPEYNEKNTTNYKMLPPLNTNCMKEGNTTNKSTNGSLNITLKAGQTAVQVGSESTPLLNDDTFPLGIKYAIPLRIVSASLPILSNKDVVISLSRPFKTSVAKIKQGYGLGVKVADNIQGNDEFTVQGMFLFEEFHSYNNTNVNMSLFQGEMLPYTRIDAGKIQVKNGGGDSPDDWAESKDIAVGKWVQITFTYKDSFLKCISMVNLLKLINALA